jgi:hypothetical protein
MESQINFTLQYTGNQMEKSTNKKKRSQTDNDVQNYKHGSDKQRKPLHQPQIVRDGTPLHFKKFFVVISSLTLEVDT